MFRRLFRRTAPTAPEPGPQLGMLALRSPDGLDAQGLCRAWSRLFADIDPLTAAAAEGDVLEFAHGDRTLMLAVMPAPIPQGDIDFAVARSWMWKDAAQQMAAQQAHAVAVATPSGEPVEDAMAVSRLLGAAAAAADGVGIYWGNGGQVHRPAFFIDALSAFSEGNWPVMLWIGLEISAAGPQGPYTLTTLGLRPFGHKELEIIDSLAPIGDLRMLAYEVANYLLANGPVLEHGQTFGRSDDERMLIEHTTSRFRKGEPVIRLHA